MRKLALGLSLALALIGTVCLVNPGAGARLSSGLVQSWLTAKGGGDSAKTDLAKVNEGKTDLGKTPDSDAKGDLAKDGDSKTDLGGRL